VIDGFVDFGARHSLHFRAKCHVLAYVHPFKQGTLLEYHATFRAGAGDSVSVQDDLAFGWGEKTGNDVEECGLAAARRAEHRHDLALFNFERNILQRLN